MNAHNEQQWPEYLMLRDTGLYDDAGGLGQHIFTTAGAGYVKQKYVRADLAAQPSPVVKQNLTTQPAAAQEAVVWQWRNLRAETGWKDCTRAVYDVFRQNGLNYEVRKLYAAPVTAAPAEFDRARETPRRQRAVELLLSMGYQWHGGEWIAASTPAAPEPSYLEYLDLQNHSLRRAIHAMMAKLVFLLDEDQFADIDAIALAAGVTPAAPGIDNTTPVDRGALQMAINVLRRAGKDEVADALIDASPKGDHPVGTPMMPDGKFYDGCWERLPKGMQQHGRMLTQSWRVADSTELKRALEAGVLALMDSPKGGSEAVAAWEDGLLDADSATLQSDCNARYEVCFVISESHNGIWRAAFNPDTEAPYNGKEVPIGTFATKEEAQHACEEHAKLARGAGAVQAQAGDAEVQP